MKTGVTGYFDLEGSKRMTLRVHYEEAYDPTTAKRTVAITKLQLKAEWYPAVYYPDGTVTIDGITAVTMDAGRGTHNVNASPTNEFRDMNGEMGSVSDIGSNDDGSKSITISVSVHGYTKDGEGSGNGWSVQGSQTIVLTKIHRGLVYFGDEAYQLYIDNVTDWELHGPQIANGSTWNLFS